MSIDGFDAEINPFLNGIALQQRRAQLCEMAMVLSRFIDRDNAIFAHLFGNKKF